MSLSPTGDFTCSELQTVHAMARDRFDEGGASLRSTYVSEAEAVRVFMDVQTAQLPELADINKKKTVKLMWTDVCPQEAEECPDDYCDISGVESSSNCEEYKVDKCVAAPGFSVTEEVFYTNEFDREQVVSQQHLRAVLTIENEFNKRFLEFTADNAGVNQDPISPWQIQGDTTFIPAHGWNGDMMGYLDTTLAVNRLRAGQMVSTQFLRTPWINTQRSVSAPGGEAEQLKLNAFGTPVFDLFQLSGVLGGQGLLMYDPSSMALVTRSDFARYGASGLEINGATGAKQRRYTVRGITLPIDIDVIYQMECIGKDIKHTWKYFINYGQFLNPLGCDGDRTGILKFQCGTPA